MSQRKDWGRDPRSVVVRSSCVVVVMGHVERQPEIDDCGLEFCEKRKIRVLGC
jgi:hypothetical protein